MKHRERNRDYLRLLLVILFYFSPSLHSPLVRPFQPDHRSPLNQFPPSLFYIQAFAVLLNFAVEIFEFFRDNYAWERLPRQRVLLLVRIAPWALLFALYPDSARFVAPRLVPIFGFYLFLAFPPRLAPVTAALPAVLQFLLNLEHIRGWGGLGESDYVLLVYRLFDVALLLLFAFFWRRGKESWKANQELTESLQETQGRLREYADKVAHVVALEERARLSRDIHDSLGHNLTAAAIQLSKAAAFFERDPAEARRALEEARNCVHEGMGEVRSVVEALNRDGIDLFEEIRKMAARLKGEGGPEISVSLTGSGEAYNKAVLFAFFRFFQEGITNALKHAGAGRIFLSLDLGAETGKAEIRDDGVGFDPAAVMRPGPGAGPNGGHYGLIGLEDRIRLVRGRLTIDSAPGRGTSLRAELPRDPVLSVGRSDRDQPNRGLPESEPLTHGQSERDRLAPRRSTDGDD